MGGGGVNEDMGFHISVHVEKEGGEGLLRPGKKTKVICILNDIQTPRIH